MSATINRLTAPTAARHDVLMSNTQYPTPAEVTAALDALTADLANVPTYTFTERNYGGLDVTYNGVPLGWVVNIGGCWAAWKLSAAHVGTGDSRAAAANYLGFTVANIAADRRNFEQAMTTMHDREQRFQALITR